LVICAVLAIDRMRRRISRVVDIGHAHIGTKASAAALS
jgi:hypothetical protein